MWQRCWHRVCVVTVPPSVCADTRFAQVADPTSGMYGKHLSASQIGAIIGAPETDVRTVSEWLVANGASPNVELLATGDYLVARFHDKSQALRVMRTATTALPALVEIVTRADPDALSLPADLEVAAAKHAAVRRAQSTQSPVSTSSMRSFKPSPLAFGDPNSQRQAYGIPTSERGSSPKNRQMVWGPGTCTYLVLLGHAGCGGTVPRVWVAHTARGRLYQTGSWTAICRASTLT